MHPHSRNTLAVYFGSLFILAIVVSFFMQDSSASRGQVIHTEIDATNGFAIEPNTNVYFTCPQNGVLLGDTMNNGSSYAYWIYEFVGNEPPYTGRYFISDSILSTRQIPSYNALDTIVAGKMYYVTSQTPLTYRCDTGLLPTPVCGNGTIEGLEICDNVSGCTHSCTAQTGYSCDATSNTCTVLVPPAPNESQDSVVQAQTSSVAAIVGSSQQSSSASIVSSDNSSSEVSSTQTTSAVSSSSVQKASSQSSQVATTAPVVEFDKFEMDYTVVAHSDALKNNEEFTLEIRIKNTANAPRLFNLVHTAGITNNPTGLLTANQLTEKMVPDFRQRPDNCTIKSLPYFSLWRDFCNPILGAGEERILSFPFSVKTGFTCSESLYASTTLYAKAASNSKNYSRSIKVFPSGCGSASNPTSDSSCPKLASIQGDKDYISVSSPDKTLYVYKFFGDNNGVARSLGSIIPATCTEREIVRPQDIPATMRLGEVYVSDAKDVLYELSEWYTSSGNLKRSLHRIDGITGVNSIIIPNAPKNTGVKSIAFSDDGKTVVFVASFVDIDNDPKTNYNNADGSAEFFMWKDGVITQLTNCTSGQYGDFNSCNAVEPIFTGSASLGRNRYVQVKLNYNPINKAAHASNQTYKYYQYDTEDKKLVDSASSFTNPLAN